MQRSNEKKSAGRLAMALGLTLLASVGCGGVDPMAELSELGPEEHALDGGRLDARTTDSGQPAGGDAGLPDAGRPDAGTDGGSDAGFTARPVSPTTLTAKLAAAGVDLNNPPDLTALTPGQRQIVMTTFTAALGVDCSYCHLPNFADPTPMKNISRHMWREFVVDLKLTGAGALYCDSCHHGSAQVLDRTNAQATSAFMATEFLGKLARRDATAHSCSTCHGNPFDPSFLAAWAAQP
ncbi:MAG: multiheme c-type cytochrome [Myxococcaceae bacterium]